MNEQIPPEIVTPPLNRPGRPDPAQPDPAPAREAELAAGLPSGQAVPGNTQPEAAAPPGPEAAARPADAPKGAWRSTPGAGSKAGTQGDDVDQLRRDDRYLAAMVASVPLAAGEDGRADLALAHEIHAAVEPKDIFDRWRVEDLFHGTRELTRYRTQRVALPHAARFKAIVALLMQFKHVYNLEAAKTARDYLGLEPKEREQAQNLLRIFGITDAAINTQAAELHEKTIAALDRLIAQRETRRSSIVREVKRENRRGAKEKAQQERSKPDQPELALH